MSPIKERIFKYLEINGISKASFYEAVNISASNFKGKGAESELGGEAIAKILTYYEDLNADWLLTGRGEIFNTKSPKNAMILEQGEKHGEKHGFPKLQKSPCFELDLEDRSTFVVEHTFPLRTDRCMELQTVPLYELDATAGLVALFTDAQTQIPLCHITLPNLPPCDGAVFVRGDSMYPILKSGDIVLYKTVFDLRDGIMWGEMYLLSFELNGEEFISIKYVQQSDNPENVRLVSHNPHHSPKDIPRANIRAIALIMASIRYNTMG